MSTARSAFDALPEKQLPDVCRMVHEFKNETEESSDEAESSNESENSNDDNSLTYEMESEDEQSVFSESSRD